MSLSKPTSSPSSTTETTNPKDNSRLRVTLPQAYGYLSIAQAGTAVVFSTFLVSHLSSTALANFGGIDLTNRAIVLGRVYYQNTLLEPIVVFGSLWFHIITGMAKRGIRLYWKHKKNDVRQLTGEVKEKVERLVSDEVNEKGVTIQKITTKTTTTITSSPISRANALLFPCHKLVGYLLIPSVIAHYTIHRLLPRRQFGDSSYINVTYVTLALKKWPKTAYLSFFALAGLTIYHAVSGAPAAFRVLSGAFGKKNGEKASQSEKRKKKEKIIRAGLIATSIGLLASGLIIIGGRFGRDYIRIPLRRQYLKVYGRVYPASWVRY